jgi:hypothetical protein
MKTLIYSIVVILFAGCCFLSVDAQVHSHVKAAIPFDFSLQGRTFTAGEYVISSLNPESDGGRLVFRPIEGKNGQIAILTAVSPTGRENAEGPSLIFNRYGSKYFFSELRNPSENFAARARQSLQEKKLAEKAGPPKREFVALARETGK